METRTNLLKLLKEAEDLQKEFQENYEGPGLLKKFKGGEDFLINFGQRPNLRKMLY